MPTILPVTRFPAQDHVGGDTKVPSIVYYDESGGAKALGAEALQESVIEQAEEDGWKKSEWFKLHLRPDKGAPTTDENTLPPLPKNKRAQDVFADFLRYLLQCARVYIGDHFPDGTALWIKLQDSMEFVLTHPNGWEGEQQSQMRAATIIAGLVPNTRQGRERIHFVTEGEASLHFCVANGLATDPLQHGKGVIIVDAGGGTVDISAYRKVNDAEGSDRKFEEIARAECLFNGSIFVSNRARQYLESQLQGSKFADDVEHIRQCFDKTSKLRFRATDEWSYIRFGRARDKDEALNISNGQMKLPGAVVAGFFRPSLDAILLAILNQCNSAKVPISSVLLVGGFAASEWLYSELKEELNSLGMEVSRPDSHVNKAVADGAVSYFLDRFVSARISKHTYGLECNTVYEPNNSEHLSRSHTTYMTVDGHMRVPHRFSSILMKNVRVSETTEFRERYVQLHKDRLQLQAASIELSRYIGEDEDPRWTDIDPDDYPVLCQVHADTSQAAKNLRPRMGQLGLYYCLDIEVVLSFGLTELKAQIAWFENGIEKRGPAELVY